MGALYEVAAFTEVEPFQAMTLMLMIENAVNKALIQHERIMQGDLSLQETREAGPRTNRIRTALFSDIHHYFICWGEVSKLYDVLAKVQPTFKALPKTYANHLSEHRSFRNHLEHIDQRVERGISDLGNLSNDKFSFDGKQIDIGQADLQKLMQFYMELIGIARKNFKQPHHP